MVIEQLPPLAVIKHLRGHLDVYVLHVGGVDKVVLRAWPVKGKGYNSQSFLNNKNAATLTIQTYRNLSNRLKIICNSYHKGLNDTFLDHFRAGFQSTCYKKQTLPCFPTDFEMSNAISPPFISIRFFRNEAGWLYFDKNHFTRAKYTENVSVRHRGVTCQQVHYARPLVYFVDLPDNGAIGWSTWFNFAPNKEISLYADNPTPSAPLKPWFGPFPISNLYLRYLNLL